MANALEVLYKKFDESRWISPDPLEFVYRYRHKRDREVAGLIAACLAYGRVQHIRVSVAAVLDALAPSPYRSLMDSTAPALHHTFRHFKHRWTTGEELAGFLDAVAQTLRSHRSLEACFHSHHPPGATTTLHALEGLTRGLRIASGPTSLIPAPEKGSACKRLHLYLRWMIRKDNVDPGCWSSFSPAILVVPLDTHMFRIGRALGLTRRKTPNRAAALEITEGFARLCPEDPVRYDFALTRFGIRPEMDIEQGVRALRNESARIAPES